MIEIIDDVHNASVRVILVDHDFVIGLLHLCLVEEIKKNAWTKKIFIHPNRLELKNVVTYVEKVKLNHMKSVCQTFPLGSIDI